MVPPRALMAWDRTLLSKTQHLCLLISGFCGVYPVIKPDGLCTTKAIKASTDIQFRIGLTQSYKPGKEEARSAFRKHGLVLDESDKEIPQEPLDPLEASLLEQPLIIEEEEDFDPGRFDHFSLSTSLEALMNQSFLKLVQYRLAFGLNWGGAEKLLNEVEKTQSSPQEALCTFHKVIVLEVNKIVKLIMGLGHHASREVR
jgi:ubiquitin-conjugating enzyme E2 Q